MKKHYVLIKRTIHLGCYVAVDAPSAAAAVTKVETLMDSNEETFSQDIQEVLDDARVAAHRAAAENGCCLNDTCFSGDTVVGQGHDFDLDLPGVTTPEMRASQEYREDVYQTAAAEVLAAA